MSAEWVVFALHVILFLKLRKIKPFVPYPDLGIDGKKHGMPIKDLIVSESLITLTTILLPIPILLLLQSSSDPLLLKKYLFGLILSFNFVLILKLMVGRPRPNAIAIESQYKKLKEEVSMKVDHLLESRQSFPSGHAFLSGFASTFFIVILFQTLEKGIPSSTAQMLLFLLGTFPGICQANTYWHHWTDVIVGHLIGSVAAIYSHFFLL